MPVGGNSVLGIDIGGSSVKGAIVDVVTGQLSSKRIKIKHKKMPNLETIVESISKIRKKLDYPAEYLSLIHI